MRIPYVHGSDTSAAAAEAKEATAATDEAHVLAFLRARGSTGATDDEVEQALGLIHQNASARRRTLVLRGMVYDSGQRRQTRTGRLAVVWYAVSGEPHVAVPRRVPTARERQAEERGARWALDAVLEHLRCEAAMGGPGSATLLDVSDAINFTNEALEPAAICAARRKDG